MNVWTKSLLALTLTTGPLFAASVGFASPALVAAASAQTPAHNALTALSVQANGPLPAGTHLLSVNLADGLATVNFSREFQTNFAGGDTQSIRTVSAVLRTLGQFPTVDRVQILVSGSLIDTYGGMLSLSSPLPVIRPTAPSHPNLWLHRTLPAKTGQEQSKKT